MRITLAPAPTPPTQSGASSSVGGPNTGTVSSSATSSGSTHARHRQQLSHHRPLDPERGRCVFPDGQSVRVQLRQRDRQQQGRHLEWNDGWTTQAATNLANGGYGTITGGTAPVDTDSDGIPDAWETSRGLSATDASDALEETLCSGYTNLRCTSTSWPTRSSRPSRRAQPGGATVGPRESMARQSRLSRGLCAPLRLGPRTMG